MNQLIGEMGVKIRSSSDFCQLVVVKVVVLLYQITLVDNQQSIGTVDHQHHPLQLHHRHYHHHFSQTPLHCHHLLYDETIPWCHSLLYMQQGLDYIFRSQHLTIYLHSGEPSSPRYLVKLQCGITAHGQTLLVLLRMLFSEVIN